jgi:PAS domain S-box-containing protein
MTKSSNAPHDADLERERLKSLINSMADGVIAVDENCRVVLYNGAALDILDINSSITNLYLQNIINLVDINNQPLDAGALVRGTTSSTTRRDTRLCYPDGSRIGLYLSIAPVRLGYGENGTRCYVVLLRDITREKSLEEERDEFISVVSHELRTPIAIAEGNISNAQLLLEKTGNLAQVNQALKITYEQITFLSGMINDLSTLSRAERGRLVIEADSINVRELIEMLIEDYQDEASAKGLDIITEYDPQLELLNSSRLYVREILQNFMTNALKYTKTGSITVRAMQRNNGVQIEITDTGIGISTPDQERVFDKFFRSEDFRLKETSGTGLGLYVTMKLARLLNAEITLHSELNQGSTFSIFVPNLK